MTRRRKCGCTYTATSDASVRNGICLSGELVSECEQHRAERKRSYDSHAPAVLAPVDVAEYDVHEFMRVMRDLDREYPLDAKVVRAYLAHMQAGVVAIATREGEARAAVEQMAADLAAAREENALLRNAAEREKLNLMAEASALRQRAEAAEGRTVHVATIAGVDEYGPRLEWGTHWVDVGVGAKLYVRKESP